MFVTTYLHMHAHTAVLLDHIINQTFNYIKRTKKNHFLRAKVILLCLLVLML